MVPPGLSPVSSNTGVSPGPPARLGSLALSSGSTRGTGVTLGIAYAQIGSGGEGVFANYIGDPAIIAPGAIVVAAVSRALPHPANFAPMSAMALFGAASLRDWKLALVVPLLSLFASDVVLGILYWLGSRAWRANEVRA